ncbi:hypothetical protein MGYG_00379 [Nannizzia gypsea CBS 118893]|uniref:Uncharacterized protein n=1 Tax=Arthroderma gypseum (strain ATCC MYA-4604 / CBS 118893) TaxID=535722 RepID=E5QZH4_ARTGP|nr:hypothetical protein MGYG_00379 [Nannizzia gypsea CBS 118893]EFQ97340.1 hypothetical protein MGYG_00379 [Nannizzia gypsea CBS 118893]
MASARPASISVNVWIIDLTSGPARNQGLFDRSHGSSNSRTFSRLLAPAYAAGPIVGSSRVARPWKVESEALLYRSYFPLSILVLVAASPAEGDPRALEYHILSCGLQPRCSQDG